VLYILQFQNIAWIFPTLQRLNIALVFEAQKSFKNSGTIMQLQSWDEAGYYLI